MELEYMLYFLLLISVGFNFWTNYKNYDLKDELNYFKKTKEVITDEEMIEQAKKLVNKADFSRINQGALNIWYNWCLRQIKLLKSKEIEFNVID